MEAVEAAAHRYRVAVKGNRIEVYEQIGPDYNELVSELHLPGLSRPGLAEELRALEERHAHYTPVLRFTLLVFISDSQEIERVNIAWRA